MPRWVIHRLNPGHRKRLGRGRTASTRGPGPRCSRSPPPLAAGLGYPAPPRGGVRGREIPHGVSVCARLYTCEVVRCPGASRGRFEPRRHARLRPPMREKGSWPTGTPASPSSSTPLPSGRRANPQTRGERGAALPSSLGPSYGHTVPSTEEG